MMHPFFFFFFLAIRQLTRRADGPANKERAHVHTGRSPYELSCLGCPLLCTHTGIMGILLPCHIGAGPTATQATGPLKWEQDTIMIAAWIIVQLRFDTERGGFWALVQPMSAIIIPLVVSSAQCLGNGHILVIPASWDRGGC